MSAIQRSHSIINSETVAEINFSQFYGKRFKIFLDVFTLTINNRLQIPVILLHFHETFCNPDNKKTCTKDVIEAMTILQVCPEILSNEPECSNLIKWL